jgi:hypothetical protein
MGFTKFTQSESVETHREEEKKKISSFVKQAGKEKVEDLSDEQKEELQQRLTR